MSGPFNFDQNYTNNHLAVFYTNKVYTIHSSLNCAAIWKFKLFYMNKFKSGLFHYHAHTVSLKVPMFSHKSLCILIITL